jgi:hypothetical protein
MDGKQPSTGFMMIVSFRRLKTIRTIYQREIASSGLLRTHKFIYVIGYVPNLPMFGVFPLTARRFN